MEEFTGIMFDILKIELLYKFLIKIFFKKKERLIMFLESKPIVLSGKKYLKKIYDDFFFNLIKAGIIFI